MKKLNLELVRLSSKGQLVIPQEVREKIDVEEGDIFAVSSMNHLIVLKKIESPILREELADLKEVEKAWKEIEKGRYKKATEKEFLTMLRKW